jgi:hypothetical protein
MEKAARGARHTRTRTRGDHGEAADKQRKSSRLAETWYSYESANSRGLDDVNKANKNN